MAGIAAVSTLAAVLVLAQGARVLQPGQTVLEAEEPGVLRGTAVDGAGEPVAELELGLFRPRAARERRLPEPWRVQPGFDQGLVERVRTDGEGRFSFAGLPPGRWVVRALPDGVRSEDRTVVLTREAPRAELVLRVDPGSVASGRVVAPDGAPRAGVYVFVAGVDLGDGLNTPAEHDPVRTGGDGRFRLLGVPPGTVYLQAGRHDLGFSAPTVLSLRPSEPVEDLRLVLPDESEVLGWEQPGRVGVELEFTSVGPVVKGVVEDGPAARAGLRRGDLLTQVEGRPTRFMTQREFIARVRGRPGTPVDLTVARKGGEPFVRTLVRATLSAESP